MFDSLLVANRGEIAVRVLRTAKRLGIRTIAIYSDADADALHVQLADEAVRIGPPPATDSYLNRDALLRAVCASGAAAVHPGYGFLSENADFAAAVEQEGVVFVGPPAEAIRSMGSKIEAKRLAAAAGAPVVPGYAGDDQSAETLAREAQRIGYPVLVKASMGGGGRGMRIVAQAEDLADALAGAKREAMAAFADDALLLERYLAAPKHIEIQILADATGRTLSLFERDCSVQRRHQKVIEEAPAPTVDAATRRAMGEAAVAAARAVGYVGAGTVEFMVEDDAFYFLEMNTRLQVEHPVTEAILGLDLVEWQLRIAGGECLAFGQDELAVTGHAIESRLYAESPRAAARGGVNFLPSTGELHRVSFPDGVRVDTGVRTGSEVSAHYDPLLAKVIAHGDDRPQAIALLRAALRDTELAGVEHNVPWLLRVLDQPAFVAGTYTTATVGEAGAELLPEGDALDTAIAAVTVILNAEESGPWSPDGYQVNLPHGQTVRFRRARERIELRVVSEGGDYHVTRPEAEVHLVGASLIDGLFEARVEGVGIRARITIADAEVFVMRAGATQRLTLVEPDAGAFGHVAQAGGRIVAPMPGQIVSVNVAEGDQVQADQVLVVLEAMKMEHQVRAPSAGKITALLCASGDRVVEGAELVSVGTS